MWQDLYKGLVVDSETLGLAPSGMHQFAQLDLETDKLTEWWLEPHRVESYGGPFQDRAGIRQGSQKVLKTNYQNWQGPLAEEYGLAPGESLADKAPWIQRQLDSGAWDHLKGQTRSQRQVQLAGLAAKVQVLGANPRDFWAQWAKQAQDRTVWIANAPFESSVQGAMMLGARDHGALGRFKAGFETQTRGPAQLFVTGVETQKARATAQVSGDWRGVWRAYLNGSKGPGTKVRDIQDVIRAMTSYGNSLGIINQPRAYQGTQMDLVGRLYAALDNSEAWSLREAHAAGEDTVWEKTVLREVLEGTWALQQVDENTPEAEALVSNPQSAYHRTRRFLQSRDQLMPLLEAESAAERLERAAWDLRTHGKSRITTGRTLGTDMEIGTYGGGTAEIHTVDMHYRDVTNLHQVGQQLAREGYDPQMLSSLVGRATENFDAGISPERLTEQVTERVRARMDRPFATATLAQSWQGLWEAPAKTVELASPRMPRAATAVKEAPGGRAGMVMAAGAVAITALGLMSSEARGKEQPATLLSPTYYDWLGNNEMKAQAEPAPVPRKGPHRRLPDDREAQIETRSRRWGEPTPYTWDGMSHGWYGQGRGQRTDFGSPYQGPTVSNQVIMDSDYRRRREDWMLSRSGVRRFSAQDRDFWTPFFQWKAKLPDLQKGSEFIYGGTPAGNYSSLQGDNLRELELNDGNWVVSAEDADTLKIRRAGFVSALKYYMGAGAEYSIRVVGADSPEIQHGEKAGQPWGRRATEMARDMIEEAKSVKLVYDPDSSSYGRTVGTLILDDKNYSQELVKRGAAGFLPYGKERNSMIRWDGMKAAEDRARRAGKGMWSTPYFQTIRQFDPENKVTFHSYVHEQRTAGSLWLATAHEVALQSQAAGRVIPGAGQAQLDASMGFNYKNADKLTKDGDMVRPGRMSVTASNPSGPILEQARRIGGYNSQRARSRVRSSTMSAPSYGNLAGYQQVDDTGTGTDPFSRRQAEAYRKYEAAKKNREWRKERMANDENAALNLLYAQHTNHHRMGS